MSTNNATSCSNSSGDDELNLLGVSVHWLTTGFLEEIRSAGLDVESVTIHNLESFDENATPGFIRQRGRHLVSPADGKLGASYVHSLFLNSANDGGSIKKEDCVGPATHMLSYSWGYRVQDIASTLDVFCRTHCLEPKRTYIWICCLCVNQHRVMEQKVGGGSGLLNFEDDFPRRIHSIGHMLAMMTPWNDPLYLKRVWCIYEIYTAIHDRDCEVTIVMSPDETRALKEELFGMTQEDDDKISSSSTTTGDLDALYKALAATKVQNATATFENDRIKILTTIESQIGYAALNQSVNAHFRSWVRIVVGEMVESCLLSEETAGNNNNNCSIATANSLYRLAEFLRRNMEPDESLALHQHCLAIRSKDLGVDHPDVASSLTGIGLVLADKGDCDGALEKYHEALSIRVTSLGTEHAETAHSYNHIGDALHSIGDFPGALLHHREALSIQERKILQFSDDSPGRGGGHNDVARSYSSIGSALRANGDFQAALIETRKSLSIRESALGREHPDTGRTYNQIGALLKDMEDYDGALEEHHKALAIQKSVLGSEHSETANSYTSIGSVLMDKGEYDAALTEYNKALFIYESLFGEEHPSISAVHNRIEVALYAKVECDPKIIRLRKTLLMQERLLGSDHPVTNKTRQGIDDAIDAIRCFVQM